MIRHPNLVALLIVIFISFVSVVLVVSSISEFSKNSSKRVASPFYVIFIVAFLFVVVTSFGACFGLHRWEAYQRRRAESRDASLESERAVDVPRTQPRKRIILSPKQILGLDDVSYLSGLPDHQLRNNASHVTVFPANVSTRFDGKKLDFHKEQGVNPWDVEYQPNPVLFSHLKLPSPSLQPLLSEHAESNHERSSSDSDAIRTPSLAESSSSSSNNTINLSILSDSGSSRTSYNSRFIDFGSKKPDNGPGILDPNHVLYGNQDDFLQVLTVSSSAVSLSCVNDEYANLEETSSHMVHSKLSTTAPSPVPGTLSTASAPTPSTIEDEKRLLYACPNCPRTFRTPGLLRNHYNRTHNLRYKCDLCNCISFGLAADLKRHKKHVHQQGIDGDEIYRCTIPGCSTPTKIFRRKDNFNRHVKRCRKRIGKEKGKERAEPEVKEEQGPEKAHMKSRNMGI